MANFAFGRVYHLQVIASKVRGSLNIAEITTNRMNANIKFSSTSSATNSQKQTITLTNLDRDVISTLRGTGVKVVLRAGYEQQFPDLEPSEFPIIYEGEVTAINVSRTNSDTITMIELASAVTEKKVAVVSESFSKFSSLNYIITSIASKLETKFKINLGSKEDIVVNRQLSYSGTPLEVLERLGREYGLLVYLENEILKVVDKNDPSIISRSGSKATSPVVYISNEKIKGSLSFSTDLVKKSGTEDSTEVEFTTLLDSRLEVGLNVRVEVEGRLGDYTIETLNYKLDTHGNVWDTCISAKSSKSNVGEQDIFKPITDFSNFA